jgi:hypothetical protein
LGPFGNFAFFECVEKSTHGAHQVRTSNGLTICGLSSISQILPSAHAQTPTFQASGIVVPTASAKWERHLHKELMNPKHDCFRS